MELYGIPFLFYFLPLFLAFYYITPEKEKALVMILGSVIFYSLQKGTTLWQVGIVLGLVILVFLVGMVMREHRWLLPVSLSLLTVTLVVFKIYRGGALLPVGMSFYLFQMAAYLIDVRRRRIQPERDLISFGSQILMFPKLLSGPLMEPEQLQAQSHRPKLCLSRFREGLQELVAGLSLKVLLADRLAAVWSKAALIGYESISPQLAWGALIGFSLRLYFDFWGYSTMAVGLGKMMGYELPKNFREPWSAKSVSGFFRRWHMTLGRWFREYVYIPLGGDRGGKWRTVRNVLLVWMLTGLWHGLGGSYLLWGLYLGALIAIEKLWLGKWLQKLPAAAHIYTVLGVLLSWVPFAVGDLGQVGSFTAGLFGQGGSAGIEDLRQSVPILLVGIFFATPIPGRVFERFREHIWFDMLLFLLFWLCIWCIATTSQDPFLYYRF